MNDPATILGDPQRAKYIGSEVFRRPAFDTNHPLRIVRHAAVHDIVTLLGWLPEGSYCEAMPASAEQLLMFHDPAYLAALQYADTARRVSPSIRQRHHFGTLENPLFEGVFERAATTVGGSILAAELALEGYLAFHPSGGTHHGRADRASGFCYMNDPVFAILTLLKGGCTRVVYVDLDAHHGDGVEAVFAGEPRVRTISIHEENRWPHSGRLGQGLEYGAYNLPVPRGCNDSEFGFLVDKAVLPLTRTFDADALVICCGADCLAGDPLSGMMLSNVALWDAVEKLLAIGQPSVILGGGGYNPWTLARCWAGLWGRIAGHAMPEMLPDDVQAILRVMDCDLIDQEDIDEIWMTRMADSPCPGPIRETVKSLVSAVMPQEGMVDDVA